MRFVETHGQSKGKNKRPTRLYRVWTDMHSRCYNKYSNRYHSHGQRGIVICDSWHKFENFRDDMGPHPGGGYSIERKDNNGNYEKDNCYWATPKQQARNTRRNRIVVVSGVEMPLIQAIEQNSSLRYGTVWWRLENGWSVEKALEIK
jgi:hypothetical protein